MYDSWTFVLKFFLPQIISTKFLILIRQKLQRSHCPETMTWANLLIIQQAEQRNYISILKLISWCPCSMLQRSEHEAAPRIGTQDVTAAGQRRSTSNAFATNLLYAKRSLWQAIRNFSMPPHACPRISIDMSHDIHRHMTLFIWPK